MMYTKQHRTRSIAASTSITIRLTTDLKHKLQKLADDTRLSKSFLAAEAVSAYVDRELEIIDGIRCGLADVADGTVVSHNAAMAEIYDVVDAASRTGKT